jgi:hypothetical protein
MKYKIASIISYSSYHNSFIERVIQEALKVSEVVIVVSYDKFFDGKKDEDIVMQSGNGVKHVWLTFDNNHPSRHYHNMQRVEGYKALKASDNDYDFVFFIDSDEVLEGDRVKLWLEECVEPDKDYKLAHFWYYRDTCFRANRVEEGAVLVSAQTLKSPDMEWFGNKERENYSKNWNYMAGYKNQVLGHHYSWAGTKEMLMRKVSSWGHNQDNFDWKKMLEEEFSHEFNYSCPFKPHYSFIKVDPYIGFTFNE